MLIICETIEGVTSRIFLGLFLISIISVNFHSQMKGSAVKLH